MLGIESGRSWVRVPDVYFFFFICLSCDKKALEIKHMLSADYVFGKCKNHEMPYYIKFLNRKGIEV